MAQFIQHALSSLNLGIFVLGMNCAHDLCLRPNYMHSHDLDLDTSHPTLLKHFHCYICSNSEIYLNLLLLSCNFKYMPDLTVNTTNGVKCFLSLCNFIILISNKSTPKPTFILILKHYHTMCGYLGLFCLGLNSYYSVRVKHRAFYIDYQC